MSKTPTSAIRRLGPCNPLKKTGLPLQHLGLQYLYQNSIYLHRYNALLKQQKKKYELLANFYGFLNNS